MNIQELLQKYEIKQPKHMKKETKEHIEMKANF